MNNEELTQNIISMLKEKSEKDYKDGESKREAHSKSLGLLKAKFIVKKDLEDKYRVGVFKYPRSYDALIRVSNSITSDDSKKDVRGFSIKLLGVDGKKVLDDEKYTQDFVLISTQTMPIGTLKLFHDAIYYMTQSNPLLFGVELLKQRKLYIIKDLLKLRKHHTSPLDIEYFSTTPYMFSNDIVKYKIVPKSSYKSELPKKLTSTYLTENMQKHLDNNEAIFDFLVQFRTDSTMPINDASIKWDEEKSTYIKVATIKIFPQKFTTDERNEVSENLSFSPGHSLIVHKPIGDINEGRMKIYEEMSKFRHEKNNEKLFEPDESFYINLK